MSRIENKVNKPIVDFYPEVNWIFTAYSKRDSPELYKWIYNRFINIYSNNINVDNLNIFPINFLNGYNVPLFKWR